MSFISWLRNPKRSGPGEGRRPQKSRCQRTSFRPQLEALEDRCVPSTLTVTNNLDSGPGSLRAEIAAANSGDTVVFDPSLAGTTIQLTSGELVINKNLTIQGPEGISGNGSGTYFGGPGTSRVFEVDGAGTTVTLSGLTITNGEGVYAAGTSHVGDGQGGAVLNYGVLTLSGCTVSHSFVAGLGGGICNDGTLTVTSCTVSNNSAGVPTSAVGNGGGIYNAGTLTVSGSTVSENFAHDSALGGVYGNGGGIYNAGSLTVSNSSVVDNLADFAGDGIFNADGATGSLAGSGVAGNGYGAFGYNYGEYGGGIYNAGTLTLSDCIVTDNYASFHGGGIYNSGKLTIKSSSIVYDLYNVGHVNISKDSTVVYGP
jgi:hypothetical protein